MMSTIRVSTGNNHPVSIFVNVSFLIYRSCFFQTNHQYNHARFSVVCSCRFRYHIQSRSGLCVISQNLLQTHMTRRPAAALSFIFKFIIKGGYGNMKIKQFLKENITVFLSYIIIFILYRKLLGSSFALLLTIFFAAYGSAVVASQYGKSRMIYLEKAGMLTTKKLFFCSILMPLPIYLFWFLFSIIPVPSYEVWLITGLPITFISGLPLYSLSQHWK